MSRRDSSFWVAGSGGGFGGDDQGGRAVIHAGCVSGRDRAAFLAEGCLELGQFFQRRVTTRMFVGIDDDVAFSGLDRKGCDFAREEAGLLRELRSLL